VSKNTIPASGRAPPPHILPPTLDRCCGQSPGVARQTPGAPLSRRTLPRKPWTCDRWESKLGVYPALRTTALTCPPDLSPFRPPLTVRSLQSTPRRRQEPACGLQPHSSRVTGTGPAPSARESRRESADIQALNGNCARLTQPKHDAEVCNKEDATSTIVPLTEHGDACKLVLEVVGLLHTKPSPITLNIRSCRS
jgi:hypothetical protein